LLIKKWLPIIITGFFLCFAGPITLAANSNTKDVIVGNYPLSSEIKALVKGQAKFVSLPFLTEVFHIAVVWNSNKNDLYFKFGNLNFKFYENSATYYVNGSRRKLKNAPFEKDGQLWLPVEYLIRLGLVLKKEDQRRLVFDWQKNYLLGIEEIKYQDRPAFFLLGTKVLHAENISALDSNRISLKLSGVEAHFALDKIASSNSLVTKVQWKKDNHGALNLYFDLKKRVGFDIIQEPDQANRAILVFNYLIEDVRFLHQDDERQLLIQTSLPADYEVKTISEPRRFVVDFKEATLAGETRTVTGDGKWIQSARISQYDSHTVRVVMDLAGSDPCFVTRSPDNPNVIIIRTLQTVNRVDWADTEQGGILIVEGDGELIETISHQQSLRQLQLDLNYAQFDTGLIIPALKNDLIQAIHLINLNPTVARIQMDLDYFTGYDIQASPERRRLEVVFRRSPLIGKTIVLDAGHGDFDTGAWGRQGAREKEINLDVVMRLKSLLEEAGCNAILTRGDDSFIGLYERAYLADNLLADLFISVHTNSHPDLSVKGIEVFYYPQREGAASLANYVLKKMVQYTGQIGLGVKKNDFVVIREAQMPGVLIELGYLSNYQEGTLIVSSEFKDHAALGIFQGIVEYYYSGG
jgi:N-acetylmuramoyl-L-alanine amidase